MTNNPNTTGIPHDKEAEQAVLGSIIMHNDAIDEIAGRIKPASFFIPAHSLIFAAMLELREFDDGAIDEILIADRLKAKEKLEFCGGYSYLSELPELVPSSGNISYYSKIIQDHYALRTLISTASDIAQKSKEPDQDVTELLADAESKISEIALGSSKKSYSHIESVLQNSFERLEQVSAQKGEVTGLPTGFGDFDKITSGLQNSDLIILAARPAMGKTSLALNIAQYVANKAPDKGGVLIFSLEMANEQLANRMIASNAKIDSHTLRTGDLSQEDWDKLAISTNELSEAPIYMNDTPGITTFELTAVCKQLHKELQNGLSLVVIDYLQLMRSAKPNLPREQEIADITRTLKGLAKEFNVPVIALSQLNRSLENRSDKRPMMSDLRESGSIEQDADIILFIYRDEVYNEDSPDKGLAELIIAKHRNGSTGTVNLAFIGKYTKFANFSKRED